MPPIVRSFAAARPVALLLALLVGGARPGVAAAQAPVPAAGQQGAVGWWRLDAGTPVRADYDAATWLLLTGDGRARFETAVRAEGAYRRDGDRVTLLDGAGEPRRDARLLVRGEAVHLVGPDGRHALRRVRLLGLRPDGPPPVGTWEVAPVRGGEPMRLQFTAGGCYRIVATLRRDPGEWRLAGDTVRVTVADAPHRALLATVAGDTMTFDAGGPSARRFVRAPEMGATLPADARCDPGRR